MPSLPYSLEALLLGRKREFAGIIPDVIISEEHENEVIVTRHPVDTGANVADNAYCLPAVINCQFGWSDSSRLLNSILDFSIFKGLTTTKDVYEKLLELQAKREPFALSTGKKQYPAVIITKLKTTSTVDTESALVVDITFEEIRFAKTKEVTLQEAQQKNPQQTASVNQGGNKTSSLTSAGNRPTAK